MAIIKCPRCGKDIQDNSRKCQYCGLEREKQAKYIDYTHNFDPITPTQSNIPKCPTCGSTNLSKVSTMSKAGSVFMWGLLSQKVKKTWHCNNCKYEW